MNIAKRNSAIAVFTLVTIFVFSFVASVNTVSSVSLCFFKYLTHLDCPGCGLTRSFICISQGHWIQAFHFNILGPFVYLLFIFYFIEHLLNLIFKKGFSFSWKLPPWGSFLFFVLLIGQWILKLGSQLLMNSRLL